MVDTLMTVTKFQLAITCALLLACFGNMSRVQSRALVGLDEGPKWHGSVPHASTAAPPRLLMRKKGAAKSPRVFCGSDFVTAVNQNTVGQLVQNISQGLDNNTDGYLLAQGSAFSEAIAGTLDEGQQAVAVAVADAICEQGETADAFARAFVVTVFCDQSTGCRTLAIARAIAQANCSAIGADAYSYSYSSSYALAATLGHCKVAVPGAKSKLKDFLMPDDLGVQATKAKLRKFLPKGAMPPCHRVCPGR